MAQTQSDIRGVMVAVTGGRLLLPNATVAEVITYAEPEPVNNAPRWLLGRVRWHGWRLPLISFSRMVGYAEEEGELGAKVAVLKSLGDNARVPYFALLTQGFPRLTTVNAEDLVAREDEEGAEPHPAIQSAISLREDDAVIPDLEGIEAAISEALLSESEAA
ncbi:MAG: chemotaxis protein CheW [Xanthomonadales bacterium]|nr:chemotaxis protein CheW [Xanthomonadales bacterium]